LEKIYTTYYVKWKGVYLSTWLHFPSSVSDMLLGWVKKKRKSWSIINKLNWYWIVFVLLTASVGGVFWGKFFLSYYPPFAHRCCRICQVKSINNFTGNKSPKILVYVLWLHHMRPSLFADFFFCIFAYSHW
jgi:hypothetical protein